MIAQIALRKARNLCMMMFMGSAYREAKYGRFQMKSVFTRFDEMAALGTAKEAIVARLGAEFGGGVWIQSAKPHYGEKIMTEITTARGPEVVLLGHVG